MRKVQAVLLLQVPSMAAFPPSSQAVAVRMALDIIAAELPQQGLHPLATAHIFGPTLGRCGHACCGSAVNMTLTMTLAIVLVDMTTKTMMMMVAVMVPEVLTTMTTKTANDSDVDDVDVDTKVWVLTGTTIRLFTPKQRNCDGALSRCR